MRPIDADALLKLYKGWLPQLNSEYDFGDKRGVETCISVLEDAPTIEQPQWISVEDRLPHPHEDVLVYDKTAEAVTCGCLSFLGEWFDVPMKNEVSHWMPLPQPPKGVE